MNNISVVKVSTKAEAISRLEELKSDFINSKITNKDCNLAEDTEIHFLDLTSSTQMIGLSVFGAVVNKYHVILLNNLLSRIQSRFGCIDLKVNPTIFTYERE